MRGSQLDCELYGEPENGETSFFRGRLARMVEQASLRGVARWTRGNCARSEEASGRPLRRPKALATSSKASRGEFGGIEMGRPPMIE